MASAIAAGNLSQSQAVAAQAAADASAQSSALAAQATANAANLSQKVATAVANQAAADATQQVNAVAAQKNADAAAQTAALAAQASANATAQANALASQAATDATQQNAAVAAQKSADAAAQTAALTAQASANATAQANAVAAQASADQSTQASALAAQKVADNAAQTAAVAAAVQQQAAADALALSNAVAAQSRNDAAWVVKAPKFTSAVAVTVGSSYSGTAFSLRSNSLAIDYSRVWLGALPGISWGGTIANQMSAQATQASVQVNPQVYVLYNASNKGWYSTSGSTYLSADPNCTYYSPWIRPGTVSQMCGYVVNTGSASSPTWTLFTTSYGYTSLSSIAVSGTSGAPSTYNLTTSNAQVEIIANMTMVNQSYGFGFIFDASVGSYGQVTWISQV